MAKSTRTAVVASHLAANLDNPSDYRRATSHYMPTKQSIEFVNLLADNSLHGGGAHSLQGAYGIGKSSLGIFTLNQLASRNKFFTPVRRLKEGLTVHPSVAQVQKSGGMLAIPIIGSASPLSQRIVAGLRRSAANHIGRRPKALLKLAKFKPQEDSCDLLQEGMADLLEDKNVNPAGVLMIIDEFGRQFEHMIATGQLDDLHLLQNLAELPGKGKAPFNIVIIQHHGLEHYTNRFMSKQHAEWEKVRGRFNEFLLSNTESDTANIVSALMKSVQGNKCHKPFANKRGLRAGKPVTPLNKAFIATSKKCLPLHPMTIYILSRLARLLGQGDRTVVGWLSTHLDTGYQASLKKSNGLVYPEALFRHFFGDIQNMPTNPAIAKRFNAVHSSYSRHGAEDQDLEMRLLKTIGLLYFCQGSGLKADLDTIKYSLPEAGDLSNAFKRLVSKSLITYRRHSNEYRVWEGSDFDIQTKLNEAMQDTGFSPASAISGFAPKRVLAHKHLIETGNHRIAEVVWLDKEMPAQSLTDKEFGPRIYIWLDKQPRLKQELPKEFVWGVMDTTDFMDQLQETDALQQLANNDVELQQDAVASSEVAERLDYMKTVIGNKVDAALNSQIKWHLGNKTHANLQQATSEMMSLMYKKSFNLHNEMVNREQTSGQATLAARLLIEAMVKRSNQEMFGINKFPPERLLYECFFRTIHIQRSPSKKEWLLTLEHLGKSGLGDVFKLIARMAGAGSSGKPCTIDSIVTELGRPPYGVKPMPVLLLCCIYIIVNRDHVELFEDGGLQPTWSYQTLTRLIKSPGGFSINVPESASYPKKILSDYRLALGGTAKKAGKDTPLNIARVILARYSALPAYAQNTTSVSKKASALRRSIMTARSPDDLLFSAFPKVFGLKSFPKQEKKRKEFFKGLEATFAELEHAEQKQVQIFEKILLKECSARQLNAARKKLAGKARLISSDSRMHFSSDGFLQAILDDSANSPSIWFRNLLDKGLGILTPLDSWSDDDVAKAEFTFRTSLAWLFQASGALSASGVGRSKINGHGSNLELTEANKQELSAFNRHLGNLPQEQVVPLLLELLRQHSGAGK